VERHDENHVLERKMGPYEEWMRRERERLRQGDY
jgi:hypothetical protein